MKNLITAKLLILITTVLGLLFVITTQPKTLEGFDDKCENLLIEKEGKSLNIAQQQYAFSVLNTKELEKQRAKEAKAQTKTKKNIKGGKTKTRRRI